MRRQPRFRGFTLIELLVVITIIVVLLSLMAPALEKAIESANRAVCGANQKVIVSSSLYYALENKKRFFLPRGRDVTIAFDPKGTRAHHNTEEDALVDWPAALGSVGLASAEKLDLDDESVHGATPDDPLYKENVPGKMWDCPSRRGAWKSYWATSPLFAPSGYTMLTGYQYIAGLEYWKSGVPGWGHGVPQPPVPRRLGDPGRRVMTADVTAKVAGKWGGRPGYLLEGESWYLAGSPAHRDENNRPVGQNQGFLDGSVEWIDAYYLFQLHCWNASPDELFFYWQEDFGGINAPENSGGWARNQ